jgi:hypothetical protein
MKAMKGFGLATVLGASFALTQAAWAILPDDAPQGGAREQLGTSATDIPAPGEKLVRSETRQSAREKISSLGTGVEVERDSVGGDLRLATGELGLSLRKAFGGEEALAKWISSSSQSESGRLAFHRYVAHRVGAYVDAHADALGFGAKDLRPDAARFYADQDNVFISFDVVVEGVPVKGAGVEFRFASGEAGLELVQIHARTFGAARNERAREAALAAAESPASDEAQAQRVLGPAAKVTKASLPVVFARVAADGSAYEFAPARRLEAKSAADELFAITVDSTQGDVLEWHSLHFKVSGRVQGVVNNRSSRDGTSQLGLPFVQAKAGGWGGKTFTSNKEGFLQADVTGATVGLTSPYFRVSNSAGASATAKFSGDVLFDGRNNSTTAETTTFYHANVVREWAKEFITTSWFNSQVPANVNLGDVCNAYWNGSSINFFKAGSRTKNGKTVSCGNTGEIADVVYHEWGHGLDANTGGIDDGAYSEGIGDVVSMLITGSSQVGPGFFTDGKPVRDMEGEYQYPPKADEREVHKEGLIIGSTWYHLTKALESKYGQSVGRKTASRWFLKSLFTTRQYTDVYQAVMTLDAEGGRVGTGANKCIINKAFARHGLAKKDASCVR